MKMIAVFVFLLLPIYLINAQVDDQVLFLGPILKIQEPPFDEKVFLGMSRELVPGRRI